MAQRPTGVVGVNDLMAFGLMAGLRDAGLSVPRDVSVVGIDNVLPLHADAPGLTTVRVPVPEMAQVMVERVMSRLADGVDRHAGIHLRAHAGRARVGGAAGAAERDSGTFKTHFPEKAAS
jgi:DNA-binding LacI/PurR family transcriptional regulator